MNHTGLCRLFSLLLLLLSATTILAATVEDSLFREANEAFSRGDYDQAIAKYQQITETAGYSPAVLYNLANSYALSGKIGHAVLNFERALRLAPADSDIAGNLELVKTENGLFPKELSSAEKFFRFLSLNQWTALILMALIGSTASLLAAMKYRFSRQFNSVVGISCFLLFCLAIAGTMFRYQDFNPSVVISPDVKLFLSPFNSSATIGTLPEGRLVYPQKNHGEFSYVTDETDRKGWIQSALIEPVAKPADSGS